MLPIMVAVSALTHSLVGGLLGGWRGPAGRHGTRVHLVTGHPSAAPELPVDREHRARRKNGGERGRDMGTGRPVVSVGDLAIDTTAGGSCYRYTGDGRGEEERGWVFVTQLASRRFDADSPTTFVDADGVPRVTIGATEGFQVDASLPVKIDGTLSVGGEGTARAEPPALIVHGSASISGSLTLGGSPLPPILAGRAGPLQFYAPSAGPTGISQMHTQGAIPVWCHYTKVGTVCQLVIEVTPVLFDSRVTFHMGLYGQGTPLTPIPQISFFGLPAGFFNPSAEGSCQMGEIWLRWRSIQSLDGDAGITLSRADEAPFTSIPLHCLSITYPASPATGE